MQFGIFTIGDITTDPTTGLTHLGHRYYDPATARFISPDPLVNHTTTQALNPYLYANANPNANSDRNANANVNANSDTDSDRNVNANSDTESDSNANANSDTDSDSNSDTERNSDRRLPL